MALVLTRGKDQTIHIGENVVIRITKVQRNGLVRIAIEAPKEILILRGELVDADTHEEER